MKRERVLEIATYVIVFLAMGVASPSIGKLLDRLYFPYQRVFADKVLVLFVGVVVAIVGLAFVLWTIRLFKVVGHGTPNPKLPPKELVITGPYKFVRNPMAFGGLLFLLGEALFYYSPSLSGIAILYGIILYFNAMLIEEPELRKRFGKPYEEYIRDVPRFFPNPFPRRKK